MFKNKNIQHTSPPINIEKKKEEEMEEEDEKIFNENPLRINVEKELEKIELKNQIVIRLLENEGKKYIDFCKFYKGYPTKKILKLNMIYIKKLMNIWIKHTNNPQSPIPNPQSPIPNSQSPII